MLQALDPDKVQAVGRWQCQETFECHRQDSNGGISLFMMEVNLLYGKPRCLSFLVQIF